MKRRYWWLVIPFFIVSLLALLFYSPYLLTLAGYEIGFPVDPTGNLVSVETELTTGDRVLAFTDGDWWKAEVVEVRADGKVKVHFTAWDPEMDEVVERERLQLPVKNASR